MYYRSEETFCHPSVAWLYILSLSLSGVLPLFFVPSLKLRLIYLAVGIVISTVIFFILIKRVIDDRRAIAAVYTFAVIVGAVIVGIFGYFFLLRAYAIRQYEGNNAYTANYLKLIDLGDDSMELALMKGVGRKDKNETKKIDYEELYRTSVENYTWIFMKNNRDVTAIEIREEDGIYYCMGYSELIYEPYNTSQDHSDEDTIKSDVARSMFAPLKNTNITRPAWGVTTNKKIKNATLNGAIINHVTELSGDPDGYYFWVAEDTDAIESTDAIAELEIKGL